MYIHIYAVVVYTYVYNRHAYTCTCLIYNVQSVGITLVYICGETGEIYLEKKKISYTYPLVLYEFPT